MYRRRCLKISFWQDCATKKKKKKTFEWEDQCQSRAQPVQLPSGDTNREVGKQQWTELCSAFKTHSSDTVTFGGLLVPIPNHQHTLCQEKYKQLLLWVDPTEHDLWKEVTERLSEVTESSLSGHKNQICEVSCHSSKRSQEEEKNAPLNMKKYKLKKIKEYHATW